MNDLEHAKEKALSGELKATNETINAETIVKDDAANVSSEKPDVDPIDAEDNSAEDSSLREWAVNSDGSESFEADDNTRFIRKAPGIYVEKRIKDEWMVPRRICGPLRVAATAVNRDSDNWMLKLSWMDARGFTHSKVISKGDLSEGKKVVRLLLEGGLDIDALSSQTGNTDVIKFLLKHPVEKWLISIERTGWGTPGKWLILPDGTIVGTPEEEILFTGDRFMPFYEARGTLEEWQKSAAKPATKSSRIAFAICAAFAPLLLKFASACEGGFHFIGKTGCGKSSSLRAGLSVWSFADHTQPGCELGSWKTTEVGIETFADRHSNWPMFLDELGSAKASDVKNLPALIYMLVNGQGKRRGNRALKAARPMSWSAFFLSTGELTLEEMAARQNIPVDGGVKVRLANIPAVPDNVKDGVCDFLAPGEDWMKVVGDISEAASRKCYGTAGPEFARRLIEHIETNGGVETFKRRLSNRLKEWIDKSAPNAPQEVRRVGRRFALVAMAGEIATALGVLPWDSETASMFARICFESWRREYEQAESDGDAKGVPLAIFRAYPSKFAIGYEGTGQIEVMNETEPFIGYSILEEKNGEPVRMFLVPASFDQEARKLGHSGKNVVRAFRDAGLLINGKKDGPRRLASRFYKPPYKSMSHGPFYAFWVTSEMKDKYESASTFKGVR